jgi:putative transposase
VGGGFSVRCHCRWAPDQDRVDIGEHTRECLGGMVERSITGNHLIGELNRLATQRGTLPAAMRCDNGPEMACRALADWATNRLSLHFIPPGEPLLTG